MEAVDEAGAFDQEGVEDGVAAAQEGFGVALALGEDQIGAFEGSLCLRAHLGQVRARDGVAVVNDREGDPHSLGVLPGGIVEGRASPDAEGDLQLGIRG